MIHCWPICATGSDYLWQKMFSSSFPVSPLGEENNIRYAVQNRALTFQEAI